MVRNITDLNALRMGREHAIALADGARMIGNDRAARRYVRRARRYNRRLVAVMNGAA